MRGKGGNGRGAEEESEEGRVGGLCAVGVWQRIFRDRERKGRMGREEERRRRDRESARDEKKR